ncbi:unnamed protein product, partial [Cyprideis torosa]
IIARRKTTLKPESSENGRFRGRAVEEDRQQDILRLRSEGVTPKTIANSFGLSLHRVWVILRRGQTKSPNLKGPKTKPLAKVDEFDEMVIDNIIDDFYKVNEIPSITEIFHRVKEQFPEFPYKRMKTFVLLLKRMGYSKKTINRQAKIVNTKRLVSLRQDFLEKVARFREEGFQLNYLDETWYDTHDTTKKAWLKKGKSYAFDMPSSRGKRLVILHTGSEDGFMEGGLHVTGRGILEARADYHGEMNSTVFENYIKEKVIPEFLKRERPQVLIMDNARYHSRMEGIGDSHSWVGKKGSRASRHYLLIRHGQYVETKNRDEKRLSELGRDQACLIGARLQDLKYPYDILISSTMLRATETADLIAQYLPDVPRVEYNILNEGAPPDTPVPTPKNLQGREVRHRFSSTCLSFQYEFQDGARLEAAFREFIHRAHPTQERDSFSVIVCHGNVIRYLLCRALQQPPEAWLRMNIFHASLTWMTVAPDGQVRVDNRHPLLPLPRPPTASRGMAPDEHLPRIAHVDDSGTRRTGESGRALQQPPEAWLRMNIFHASLTWMTVAPDGQVFLSTFNDAGHLPPEKLSTNNRDTFLSTLRKRFGADVGKAEAVNKIAAQA